MNELSMLRTLRDDITEPTPEHLEQAWVKLTAAMNSNPPGRRGAARAGWILAAAATTIVTILVVVNVFGIAGGRGGADPAAAGVLEAAATATLEVSDPVIGPGQFMLVATDGQGMVQGVAGDGSTIHALLGNHDELYVPADQSDDWIWVRCAYTPIQTFGPESEKLAIMSNRDLVPVFTRAPGGMLHDDSQPDTRYDSPLVSSYDYATLPRDPQQLLDLIYHETQGMGPSPDGEALVWIADMLRWGTVPADLRASLYTAAAGIPGVTITEEQTTLNGSTGIAIGRDETNKTGMRQDIIIDPTTGRFIGERLVTLVDSADLAAGTTLASTAVTTTVVDAAPTDTAGCNNLG